jgi:hypothetical protein
MPYGRDVASGSTTWLSVVLLLAAGPAATAFGAGGDFVHIAEGLTSSTAKEGITAAYRMWSRPDMEALCSGAQASRAVRLRPVLARVSLRAGHEYPLTNLRVLALDAAGTPLPRVPIEIQVEQITPAIVDTRSDRLQDAVIVPARSGEFRFRFQTVCGSSRTAATVVAQVVR